ncbi:hypothetical protein ACTFIY_005203 [Dictyostelium cf. discoideum]
MNNNDTPPPPLNEMMSMLLKQDQQEQSNKIIGLINKQQEQQQEQQEQSNKIIGLNKQQEQQQDQQEQSNKIIDLINKQQQDQQEQSNKIIGLINKQQQEQSNKIIDLINKQQQDQQEQSKKIIDLINKQQSTHNLLEQCLKSAEIDVSMSRISDSAWNKISRKFNLFETVYDFPLTTKDNKDNTNIFDWDDRNEISRMGDCVTYLKNNIKLLKSHSIHDVHSKQNFLTRTVGDVSFRGTTDVGIFSSTDPHSSSLLISFEIKKGEPGSNDHNQSRAQLLTANSSSRFPVLSQFSAIDPHTSSSSLSASSLSILNSPSLDIQMDLEIRKKRNSSSDYYSGATSSRSLNNSCQSAQNAFEIINLFFNKDSMKIFQNNLIFTKTAIPTKFVILHSAVDVGNLDDLEGCLPDEEVQNTYIQAAIMSYYS